MRSMMMTLAIALGAISVGQAFECRDYVEPMRILGATDISLGFATEMRLQEDAVYAISQGGPRLVTVDISDLTAPTQTDMVDYGSPTTGKRLSIAFVDTTGDSARLSCSATWMTT